VPIINRVAAGRPTGHTDLDFPDGTADTHLDVPDVAGPDSFATRITGRSMEPKYLEGDLVVFDGQAKVEDGADCFVRLEPDHESTFKRVYFDEAQATIRLQPLNPDYPAQTVPREQVAGLYRAVWKFSKV
jgi:SOS-response transcriptional repressor LexA